MRQDELSPETYKQAREMLRIANQAAKKAQEENRKKGIPNVYDFNGHLYYELPNGELTKEDPVSVKKRNGFKRGKMLTICYDPYAGTLGRFTRAEILSLLPRQAMKASTFP